MTHTPWGKSQDSTKITRGLAFHSTPGHGGFLVSKGFAEKNLSQAALRRALQYGGYYAFEEDCAAAIVELEIPAARVVFQNPEAISDETLIKSLSRWYPDYLLERGITPDPEAYAKWLLNKEEEKLRQERSPNLIVAAWGLDDGRVRVVTADGAEHFVSSDSYKSAPGLNLLSNCELV